MNISKLTKKQLINDINIFYLKKGIECDNIYKISKCKLIKLIIENDIPHIDEDTLKKEIEENEKFNYYMDTICHNFIKYKNITYDDIHIIKNTPNVTSDDLNEFIDINKLYFEDNMSNVKNLVIDLYKAINTYCEKSNIKNKIEYKTYPDIIMFLNSVIVK